MHTPLQVNGDLQTSQIRFVSNIADLPHFVGLDQLHDLVNDRLGGGGWRNLRYINAVVFFVIGVLGTHPHRAAAGVVNFVQFRLIIENIAAAYKIRRQ